MTDDPPGSEPQEIPPHEAAARASEQFAFALRLAALAQSKTIRADMFPRTVLMPLEKGRIEIIGDMTDDTLNAFMSNTVLGALALSAQVMHRALEETFGKHPLDLQGPGGARRRPEDLGDREAAQEIVYMFRSAVSHDPLRPKWQCRGVRVGVFRVTQLGITFDATRLDGAPLDVRAIGGLEGYLRLLQYCERKIRRARGISTDRQFGHEREWVAPLDLTALVPPNAIAVSLSYRIEPDDASAVLFASRNDPNPVWLHGPRGEITMRLIEPQRLYFETVGGETRLQVDVLGYQHGEDAQ